MHKSFIIGTAGHIDHGKTALVQALTGVDTDRLPEEKERGITIDIGFAHMSLGDFDLSFIDVPGHERFIRNMLAGVGGIDLLMLVIAADESIKPQTVEHFEIAKLLQIPSGMIVLTKTDLVDEEMMMVVRSDISQLVQGSFLENAPVVEVSSKTGKGIPDLKTQLQNSLRGIEQRKPAGIFRLPIDRVFILKGHGTVVTGTLISGKLQKDQIVEILPSHSRGKVRSIHAHDTNVQEAFAGQRTAANLQGLEKEQLQRGDTLTEPDYFETTSLLDTKITLLKNTAPLKHNSLIRFHHLTSDLLARVTLVGTDILSPGQTGFAQLRLQKPIFALSGDRFIMRRHSPLSTVGGGIILDHMPPKKRKRADRNLLETFRKMENASASTRLSMAVEQQGIRGADERYLKSKLGLSPQEIVKTPASDVTFLRERPVLAISKVMEQKLIEKILESLKAFHKRNPLLPGIPKEELRSKYFSKIPNEVFSSILQLSIEKRLLHLEKDVVAEKGHKVELTSHEEDLATAVERLLIERGLEFPGFNELGMALKQNAENTKKIVYLLVRQGKLIKLTDDYFLPAALWSDLKKRITGMKASQKTLSVPDFKAKFGISRKYAIPLLELLDREGVTRRSGNERIIL
jgi:selenocysteine-specific elongation factor